MAAGKYDITIDRGATFVLTLTWRDSNNALVDLTGYTARMQVREKVSSPEVLLDLQTGSGITLGGAAGTITITASAAQTSALTKSNGLWAIELTSGSGVVTRLMEGQVYVSPELVR